MINDYRISGGYHGGKRATYALNYTNQKHGVIIIIACGRTHQRTGVCRKPDINYPRASIKEVIMIVQINQNWQNFNTLSGLSHTQKIAIQSHSSSRICVYQGDTPPTDNYDGAEIDHGQWLLLTERTTWIRVDSTAGAVYAEVR